MLVRSVHRRVARLRGVPDVRNGSGHGTSPPRGSVLRRCSPAGSPAPNAPPKQPPKAAPKRSAGLVSVAGDLHLRIDAINVHLTASALPPPGQQDMATTVQSAVMGAATSAAAADLAAPSGEPAPITPAAPFTCIGKMGLIDVSALAMCSDGHHFVCGYENGVEVNLWDLCKPGQRVLAELGNRGWVQSVAASADGRRVLVGSEEGLWLWDVEEGKVTALLSADTEGVEQSLDVWSVAITPDGRYGVSGGYSQGLRVWDLEKGECIGSADASGQALNVVISPDGQTATAVVKGCDVSEDGAAGDGHQLWRWHAGSGFKTPERLQGCTQELCSMSADGGVVLSVDIKGVVRRWDGQSGKGEAVFTQPGEVSCLALSPDGRRAVLGTREGSLSVWDVEGKACLAALHGHVGTRIGELAISADGRYAVSYSCYNYYYCLCVWHLG